MKKFFFTVFALLSMKWGIAQNTYPFPSTGNVGIGTTTPATTLDVNGDLTVGRYSVLGKYVFVGPRAGIGWVGQGMAAEGYDRTLYFLGTTSGWAPASFEFDGPNAGQLKTLYHVYGDGAIVRIKSGWGEMSTSGLTGNTLAIEPIINLIPDETATIRGIYYNPTITSFNGKHIAFQNTLGINIFNSTSGNTLIGGVTDDGANKLQVTGNIKATGLIIPTNAAAGKVLTSDANGNATWQTASGGSGGSSWTLDGNNVLNSNIGFVGIGTGPSFVPAPEEGDLKLAVNGNIRAKKLKITQGNWADYVFHQSYHLLPLSQLEDYIKQHQHLPEVPTTAQVGKDGVDVGDNQVLLLKKVEELTLYLIEQNKKIESQQKEMEKQRNELDSLKKLIHQK